MQCIPADSLKQEEIMDILETGMSQLDRMEHFIETMRKMSKLEQRELEYSAISIPELAKSIRAAADILSKKEGKSCLVEAAQEQAYIKIDKELVLEVTDNLLTNAIRYAVNHISIKIQQAGQLLIISIEDDGSGFTDTEEKVTQAFYHTNPQDDLKHFGLGMYISRIFCEKHGGKLKIYHTQHGGAHIKRSICNYLKTPILWLGLIVVIISTYQCLAPYLTIHYMPSDEKIP